MERVMLEREEDVIWRSILSKTRCLNCHESAECVNRDTRCAENVSEHWWEQCLDRNVAMRDFRWTFWSSTFGGCWCLIRRLGNGFAGAKNWCDVDVNLRSPKILQGSKTFFESLYESWVLRLPGTVFRFSNCFLDPCFVYKSIFRTVSFCVSVRLLKT